MRRPMPRRAAPPVFEGTPPGRQRGVMLLEALIGILIFSVGILGLIGLQAVSISNVTESRYRSEASYLANQIIGRMWIDRGNLASYALAAGATCDTGVTTSAMQWLCQVETALPGVSGGSNSPIITVAADTVTVTMRWRLPGGDARQHVQITQIN